MNRKVLPNPSLEWRANNRPRAAGMAHRSEQQAPAWLEPRAA